MNEGPGIGEVAVAGAPLARVGSGARFPWASLAALGALLMAAILANAWLSAGTYRLYLEQRLHGDAGTARQRFVVSGGRVQPQIVASGDERLVFPWGRKGGAAELRYGAFSAAPAAIEIAAVQHGTRRVLARHLLDATPVTRAVTIPDAAEAVELSNHGAVTWMDARVVRQPRLWPPALGLAALAAAALGLRGSFTPSPRPLLAALTAAISVGIGGTVLEAGLRALAPSLPWMAAVRRDLGEVQPDPRWQDSAWYGRRLRPGLRTFCEWRQGDIVRMGFLAPELAPQGRLRFPLVTDAEGFRNDDPPAAAPLVALGDSFTDALTVPAERTWPARLQAGLGLRVRNYGTAGFGPLQELEVLRRLVLPRRPQVAVLAFFGGNDLIDAERFDGLRRGVGPAPALPGWPIKDVVARFDELYTYSLFSGAARALREKRLERVEERDAGDGAHADVFSLPEGGPAFDRGLFTLPVAGARLRFAFLPPYLNILRFSPQELKARPGWPLTRDAIREMNRLLRDQGGTLVVMFVPSKSQVYLPLVASALSRAEREAAMRFLVPDNPPAFDTVYDHRLAMSGVVGELCAAEAIPFVDLTAPLEATVKGGRNAYFPDDSHWNAAGHEVAARELSAFLRGRGLLAR